jgi:Spy/CpxP family protein refolding chaperone
MMFRTPAVLVILTVVAFAAGVSATLAFRPRHAPPSMDGPGRLTAELNLNADQQKQMTEIWSALSRPGPTTIAPGNPGISAAPSNSPTTAPADDFDRRRALQKSRDEAIKRLVPADKQPELEKIFDDFNAQMNEMSERRRRTYEAAVEKTKAILTPEQRQKYEKILADRAASRRSPGSGRGWSRNPAADPLTASTTQPASRESELPAPSSNPSTQRSDPN